MEIPDISSHLVGFYDRVALRLKLNPEFVSEVARGKRESAQVESAMEDVLRDIVREVKKKERRANSHLAS